MSPALSLLLIGAPTFAAVGLASIRRHSSPPADAQGPTCPCGCGRPPGQHNPPRSNR